MQTSRLEAFSDGVIAIIITVMVLGLRPPIDTDLISLIPVIPTFLAYIMSFSILGIYWNNHHHLLRAAKSINGNIMWANLHLLFWLSLIPFFTSWVGEHGNAAIPTAFYAGELLFCAVSYYILQLAIIHHQGEKSPLKEKIGSDIKGKISLAFYTASIICAFINPWISYAIFVLVALMWFIPDKRLQGI